MTMKQMFFSALILGVTTNIAFGMESERTINADVKNMLAICEQKCSFMKDVTQNCTSKCFMEYGQQKERFLIRKYTNQCSNIPFDEQWSFKTDAKSKCIDVQNTSNAYSKWQNPIVAKCARDYMSQHQQIMHKLEIEVQNEFSEFQEEHPVLSTGVGIYNSIRRHKR